MDAKTARLVDAEIANLIAEAARLGDERRKRSEEDRKSGAQSGFGLSLRNDFVYPALVSAGLIGTGVVLSWALTKLSA